MLNLPWRWTRAARPERAVVFASYFEARGLKDRWVLFAAGIGLRRYVLASPGALGVSLRTHLLAGRFYTMSMWQDEASLMAFAHSDDHKSAVRRISEIGPVRGVLISREAEVTRPRWGETLRWVALSEPGPYRMEQIPASHPQH
jgi:heme-degrading monooxygenase HmoA